MAEFIEGFKRTHTCGALRRDDVGSQVTLTGWVQDQRDLGAFVFIVLRDRYGLTQVVFNRDANAELFTQAQTLRSEWVVGVHGEVIDRGDNANEDMATGAIEVEATGLRVFNRAKPQPFKIIDEVDATEDVRLKYRYLDLRRGPLQRNLILRSRVAKVVRDVLDEHRFLELETPYLTRSTPEGARDYLVPSRVHPSKFYALPQSPQLFKQLFMMSGYDRYYQIVRCFRDEDLRADRQPEFTQIDMELSFVDADDVMAVCEAMMARVFKAIHNIELTTPFPRMSWQVAMDRYGVDAPDTRYALHLEDVSAVVRESGFKVFAQTVSAGGVVKALRVPGGATFSRKDIKAFEELAKTYGAKGLAWTKVDAEGFASGIGKFINDDGPALQEALGAVDGDIVFFVAASFDVACAALGNVRKKVAAALGLVDANTYAFTWVVDFPMFEWDEETQRFYAMHHPFTAPLSTHAATLEENAGDAKAQAYDLVLNGAEVGGGSIRIHDPVLQERVFRLLGIGEEEAREKFGFLLDALQFGAPPHGGIAFGLDRLAMILAGAGSLRDVIAFPKTTKATDLMVDAPGAVSQEQLEELALAVTATASED